MAAAGVLVLAWLEWTRPDSEPPPSRAVVFFNAAGSGNVATLENLLNSGMDVNAKDDSFGHTALIIASRRGHLPVVELLLAKGADVNATDNYGNTALRWALRANKGEAQAVVQRLKQAGAVEPDRAGRLPEVAWPLVSLLASIPDRPVPGSGIIRQTGGV